jgi:autotransporter passenger strand-loop-strand repeat protein
MTTLSSGVHSDLTVSSGNPLVVLSGATVESSTIESGGSATLSLGAVGSALTVLSGGSLLGAGDLVGDNSAAGSVSGLELSAAGALSSFLEIEAGGVDSATMVAADNGDLQIDSGAIAVSAVISNGGQIDVYGSAVGTLLSDGFAVDYGHVVGTVVGANATEYVNSGAVTTSSIVKADGVELIYQGGSATHLFVRSGGTVYGDGVVVDAAVSSGGVLYVFGDLGSASDVTVQRGGTLVLSSGGYAAADTVLSGGTLDFEANLTVNFTEGSQPLTGADTLSGVTVSSGGLLEFINATVLSGVTLSLASGAIASSLLVSAGGTLRGPGEIAALTSVGGTVSGVTIGDTGANTEAELELLSGGHASGVTTTGFGDLDVQLGGSAIATKVGFESYLYVEGHASGTADYGTEVIRAGGVARGDTVEDGGIDDLFSGAIVSGATVISGGVLEGGGQGLGNGVVEGRHRHIRGRRDVECRGRLRRHGYFSFRRLPAKRRDDLVRRRVHAGGPDADRPGSRYGSD